MGRSFQARIEKERTNSMRLYDLTAQYKALEEMLELYPCEEEVKHALEQIEDDIEAKADGYAKIIASKDAHIEALTKEIARLTAMKGAEIKQKEWLKNNLMHSMKETGKEKFKTELFSFSIAKNGGKEPLVVDVSVDELPEDLVKVTRDVDKDKLREYIQETGDLTFGHFGMRGERLTIR